MQLTSSSPHEGGKEKIAGKAPPMHKSLGMTVQFFQLDSYRFAVLEARGIGVCFWKCFQNSVWEAIVQGTPHSSD